MSLTQLTQQVPGVQRRNTPRPRDETQQALLLGIYTYSFVIIYCNNDEQRLIMVI